MSDVDFDWVNALSLCSLTSIFEKLKVGVSKDVKTRNDLRKAEDRDRYEFEFHPDDTQFTVSLDGPGIARSSVVFILESGCVRVQDGKGTPTIKSAVLTLGDDRRCRLRIEGMEKELWQFRRMALENLFFHGL
jgi:hypothetical protein